MSFKEYVSHHSPSTAEKLKHIYLAVPANIRMSHYENDQDLKLENKFTVFPLRLPLVDKVSADESKSSFDQKIRLIKDTTR